MSDQKELGMIHTVNYEIGQGLGLNEGDQWLIDLPGQLTGQLQRMIRACQYFKVVGIDMVLRNIENTPELEPGICSGRLSYYAPTRGRCEALKNAYKAVRRAMKTQGINIHGNRQYDFRVLMTDGCVNETAFLNQATYDGTNHLTLDQSAAAANDRVFGVYNDNIQPHQTATVAFSSGFGQAGAVASSTDFVLNEGENYEGSLVHFAEEEYEFIPFSLSWGTDSTAETSAAVSLQWRPDPALYLAVLTGQFVFELDALSISGTNLVIDTAFHVSGWKSVLGKR